MKKKILIVDDDKRLRELLKDYLNKKNLEIFLCSDLTEAKEIQSFILFDLIILDRMMPTGDGIELIKIIKKNSNIPVIMLTALGTDENKIEGLKTGSDDYISKPFEPEELYLRICNLLNFYNNLSDKNLKVSFGEFIFNISKQELKKNNNTVYLTEGENNFLIKLIEKRNNIVLREELANQEFDESELRKVDVQITRLRQKLEDNAKQPQHIKTVRGKGYKLICSDL